MTQGHIHITERVFDRKSGGDDLHLLAGGLEGLPRGQAVGQEASRRDARR